MSFKQNSYDNSLFTHQKIKIAVIIYVDDLLLIESDSEKIRDLKRRLGERFDMKNQESAACFLDMQIERNRETETLMLHQKDYIEKLLKRFKQKKAISVSTLMKSEDISREKNHDSVLEESEQRLYRELIESLMYTLYTRSDCVFLTFTLD
jgi:hypothetical protein